MSTTGVFELYKKGTSHPALGAMTRPQRPGYTNTGCYPAGSACFWLIAPSVPASPLPYLVTKSLRSARVCKCCIKAPARVMVVIAAADLSSSEEAPPPKITQCLQSAGDGWLRNGCSLGRPFVLVWQSADALYLCLQSSPYHMFSLRCVLRWETFFFFSKEILLFGKQTCFQNSVFGALRMFF